jgi:uncharacterized protein YhaN
LAELASGEAGLKSARLEEALYGGGMGGLANLQRVQASIEEERESLFSASRAAKTRQINRLLEDVTREATELGHAMLKPREYQDRCKRRDESRGKEEESRRRHDASFRRTQHLTRLAEAHPLWLRLGEARLEAEELHIPVGFPADGGEEFRGLRRDWTQADQDLTTAEGDLRGIEVELKGIRLAPELHAQEPAIKELFKRIAQVESCHEHIPLRRQEADTVRRRVVARIAELNPRWDLACLEQFRTSLDQRDRVERMAEEDRQLRTRAETMAERQREKAASLAEDVQRLEQLKKVRPIPVLDHVCGRSGQYEADCETRDDMSAERATLTAHIAQLEQRIALPFSIAAESLGSLPLPLEPTVQDFARRLSDSEEALKLATRRREESNDELTEQREELLQLDSQQRIPDRQELVAKRGRRDSGWRLIRGKYIEGEQLEDGIGEWLGGHPLALPDQYEQEVAEADHLADDRQEKAELAAKRDQLTADVSRKERRLKDLEEKRAGCEAHLREVQQAWEALWSGCGIRPQVPSTMLEWLRLHAQLAEKREGLRGQESRLKQVEGRIGAFEHDLRLALPGEDGPPEVLLSMARRLVDEAREAATHRSRYEAELPERERELKDIKEELEEVGRQREVWNGRWQSLLEELGFPAAWDISLATKILEGLAKARQEYQPVPDLERRVVEMEGFVSAFETEVSQVCRLVAADLERLPAVEAAGQLNDRLEEAKQSQRQFETLTLQHGKAEVRKSTKLGRKEELEDRLAALREAAGVESDDEFLRIAVDAQRRGELIGEIDRLTRDIRRIAASEDAEAFLAELAGAEADSLALAQKQAAEEVESAAQEHRSALEEAAVAAEKVKELDGQNPSNDIVQKLESDRAELRAAVDRWAPLTLAHAILEECIARFEREHQPAMLADVGQLFSRMTGGRYLGVRQKLDEEGTILVDLAQGGSKEPAQLSTGTREQLYLAIRLAYARHYCRDSEPLPLVMDDVLANFDDDRAQSTLDVLAGLDASMQVIFLTCHQSTIDRIVAGVPGIEPIRLAVS